MEERMVKSKMVCVITQRLLQQLNHRPRRNSRPIYCAAVFLSTDHPARIQSECTVSGMVPD